MRQLLYGLNNPGFIRVLRLLNQLHAGTPFSQRFADQERDECATKTDDQRVAQQQSQIQASAGQITVHAQQTGHNAQNHHDQHIG